VTATSARTRAAALGLVRKIRLSERGSLWLSLAFVTSVGLFALLVAFLSGQFENIDPDVWGPVARGYSAYGEILGVLAVVFSLATFLFSIRKRVMQERFPLLRGTMMGWLWFHVTSGVLALMAATLHGGFGLLDYDFSSGKLIYYLLLFISVTGVLWRLLYSVVPKSAAARVGNYSRAASQERAREQELEMDKLAAGKSELLQQWKRWLLERARSAPELASAQGNFQGSPEQHDFTRLCELAESHHRALRRNRLQKKYISRLQFLRVWHVPVSILFLALVVVHLIEVYDVPAKSLPPVLRKDTSLPVEITGFHDPKDCAECHRQIYEQWQHSMHAHALNSPLMIAQSNQVTERILHEAQSPDPKRICVNCHSPIGTDLAQSETLPFPGGERANEGISCTVCHQFTGQSRPVGGAYSDGVIAGLERGRVMYGPFPGAVGNPYHSSKLSPVLAPDPAAICQNCHNVAVDRNQNEKIDPGPDLVLQTTQLEYVEYREKGGTATCGDCHMPIVKGATRVAESAGVPELQDTDAPARLVHDHSFVGTDYPLDHPGSSDPHRPKRVALLQSAATLELSKARRDASGALRFDVSITNSGTGHTLPTGFAFARQMWVEIIVRDANSHRALFVSGLLAHPTDDLCDAGTLNEADSPMLPFIEGCQAADPQLLNFQKKLVDESVVLKNAAGQPVENDRGEQIPILAPGGHEDSIQHLTGNAVARRRPSDGKLLVPLQPGEQRSFGYRVPLPPGVSTVDISARLLFRNLPPYFIRHLGSRQPKGETPRVAPLVANLDIVEMAVSKQRATVPTTAVAP
jgi:hypothetical protein